MRLHDKVGVVTGGASGIGRGIARALAAEGAHVVVADIEAERAERIAAELRATGVKSLSVRCDVTERASVETLAEQAWAEFGRVDILCNNAGVGFMSAVADLSPADAEWTFAVNVFGVLNGCTVFVPRFRKNGGGHILNTGSEHSLGVPFPGLGIYTASKHAVLAISDVLRREVLVDGIGVSILCPAQVRTDVWNAARNRQDRFGGPLHAPAHLASVLDSGMDPDEVGRIALDGILRKDFYILTHPEVRTVAEERCHEVTAAFDALDRSRGSSRQ
jgi:NAD(P)-dependent dehydrogenase (short-subunit alcohol dehydrogenase family)